MNDLRYAIRMLLKNPGFTAVTVFTLALGIGANTAIFSVVNTVLLRPLPFHEPDRLVLVWGSKPDQGQNQVPFSLPNLIDIRDQNTVFDGLAGWTLGRFNLTGGDQPEQVQYAMVSANFFSVFGVKPISGRDFLPAEDQPGGGRVVIISHNLWQRRFGSDQNLIGKTVTLDGLAHEVIGVMPASFKFASFPKPTEVWVPFGLDTFRDRKYARALNSLGVIGRLKHGMTLPQGQAEMNTIARRLAQQYPEVNAGWNVKLVALREQVVRNLRSALLILLGAVGCVLLIACANVANLMLARSTARQREIAIRAALGAGRRRLVALLFTENVLLAVAGGAFGLLIAAWAMDLLAVIPYGTPDFYTPYNIAAQKIQLDTRVLAFTAALSLMTGLIFGLAPALQSSRPDLTESLKEGGAGSGTGWRRHRARSVLVVSEIALSMLLLIGAGLMAKSFLRLQKVDPGFQPENVLTLDLSLPQTRYRETQQVAAFFQQFLQRVQTLPGAKSAGAVEFLPLSGMDSSGDLLIEGRPAARPGEEIRAHYRDVTPGYFQAMGIPTIKGRSFTDRDDREAPRVAMINETMARRFWPAENPIGKRIALTFEALRFYPNRAPEVDLALGLREIVGVVADVKHSKLETEPVPEMYIPFPQRPVRDMTVVVRSSADPLMLANAVRAEVSALDKDQPVANINTLTQLLSTSVAQPRFNSLLLILFAGVALALAAIGVYGVMSYSVSQRTRELGVRMALGAKRSDVLKLVVRQAMALAAMGIIIGFIAACALTRVMSGLLFDVSPTDPIIFAGITLGLGAVALLASVIPARRATTVDPMVALRCE